MTTSMASLGAAVLVGLVSGAAAVALAAEPSPPATGSQVWTHAMVEVPPSAASRSKSRTSAPWRAAANAAQKR